jgi:WD40 repeat protein
MRSGYEGYARLLRQVARTRHQSCLLLTSREKPGELIPLEGSHMSVRSLRLSGLEPEACEQLLEERELLGSAQERAQLIEGYGGNPLALKIVAQTIDDLFGGEIALFLSQHTFVFGNIAQLLAEQFARLSAIEQTVLLWLAILREPVTIERLLAMLGTPLPRMQVLEALEALRRRSLVERGKQPGSFTLQSVVLEYATAQLIGEAASEIEQGRLSSPSRLIEHGLERASSKEYVRQTQQRLLVAPLLAHMRGVYRGREEVQQHLLALLSQVREHADYAQGYGPANVLALLREERGHLRGLDLSQLVIRAASLQGVELQDTNLSGARLEECVLTETFDAITAVAISSNGHYWAAAGRRGEVRVWEQAANPTLHRVWQAHTDRTYALAFSPDGRLLATGSWDDTLKLWDIERSALLWSSWHPKGIQSLAIAPDGSLLATGGNDATVRLWDLKLGTQVQTLPHPSRVLSVAWSPDGHLLASGGLDGEIRLWEIRQSRPAACVRTLAGDSNQVLRLAFAPDGRTLASAGGDRTVKLWDVGEGGRLSLRETLSGHSDPVFTVAWSPDGRRLASGGFEHSIWLWDVEGSRSGTTLSGHTALVHGLAFTPDNRSLLSGSEDGTLRLWDVQRGETLRILQGYAVSLFDVDWSSDGTRMASAGSDSVVTIWELERSMPPSVLHGHRRVVYGVAFSPDGRLLASSGWDNVIYLWDASTGEARQTLRDPDHVSALSSAWPGVPMGRCWRTQPLRVQCRCGR